MGTFAVIDVRHREKRLVEDSMARVALITEIIKNALVTIMLNGKGREFQGFMEVLVAEDIKSVRLLKLDGTIISSSERAELGKKVREGYMRKDPMRPGFGSHYEGGSPHFTLQIPIYNEKPCRKCHKDGEEIRSILAVELSMDKMHQSISELRNRAAAIYGAMLLLLAVSLAVVATVLLERPLRAVSKTARKVADGDMSLKFVKQSDDEIGRLTDDLNAMLAEIERSKKEIDDCHLESVQRIEKMASIGELAAAIAHEIKNPLAGISGAIQVFAEDFADDDPRKGIIGDVLNEIDRLDKAVRDLLSFARPPAPHFIKTSIIPVLEKAVWFARAQAKKQAVEINLSCMDEISEVLIDPEQIQQVFLNIMINALHSMPGGGMISITSYLRADAKVAEVVFSDTGHGISQEDIKSIFKPFFTTKHMGTGLGLAISKNIAEKHGGTITVDSRVGSGTSFRVVLPLEPPPLEPTDA